MPSSTQPVSYGCVEDEQTAERSASTAALAPRIVGARGVLRRCRKVFLRSHLHGFCRRRSFGLGALLVRDRLGHRRQHHVVGGSLHVAARLAVVDGLALRRVAELHGLLDFREPADEDRADLVRVRLAVPVDSVQQHGHHGLVHAGNAHGHLTLLQDDLVVRRERRGRGARQRCVRLDSQLLPTLRRVQRVGADPLRILLDVLVPAFGVDLPPEHALGLRGADELAPVELRRIRALRTLLLRHHRRRRFGARGARRLLGEGRNGQEHGSAEKRENERETGHDASWKRARTRAVDWNSDRQCVARYLSHTLPNFLYFVNIKA